MGSYSQKEVIENVATELNIAFEDIVSCGVAAIEGFPPELLRRINGVNQVLLRAYIDNHLRFYRIESAERLNMADMPNRKNESKVIPIHGENDPAPKCACRVDHDCTESVRLRLKKWLYDHPSHTRKQHIFVIGVFEWLERQEEEN